MSDAVLRVENLTVAYGPVNAVRDVSFEIAPGEIVALVGRSGAGKSSIISAIMDLLPAEAAVQGSVRVLGRSPREVNDGSWRNRMVALVPQNPFSWFNPMVRIGKQLSEVVRSDGVTSRAAAKRRVEDVLVSVGLTDVARVKRARPEALSGGMRQRAAIGASLIHQPPLLLADEPTSALDPESQRHVLELLRACRGRLQAVLLVTHEASVVEELADRVLYIEDGALVSEPSRRSSRLLERPPVADGSELVVAHAIAVSHPGKVITSGLDLSIAAGESVALTGESGSGKSTLCRALAGLHALDAGVVTIDAVDLHRADRPTRAKLVQLVHQDVRGSLDGRLHVRRTLELPLRSLGLFRGEENERIEWALDVAGVHSSLRDRRCSALSGGEAQRVALARALAIGPRTLLLDEPFSALDLETRDDIIQRLVALQDETAMAIVVVLHNLDVVHGFAHRTISLDG
jgi:peptide/nickel transport system ATP-binding protein